MSDTLDLDLDVLRKQTIQALPEVKAGTSGQLGGTDYGGTYKRAAMLPPWGTRDRERALRALYLSEWNWLGQSVVSEVVKSIQSEQWAVKGRYQVQKFQNVLLHADFGRGWAQFLSKVIENYLTHDIGAFVEVIAPGNPMRAPTGAVTGISVLDSMRCYPTGDPEFPVIYYNRLGKYHQIHHTRVIQFVDMPTSDEARIGYGLCALSRAVAIVYQQMYAAGYVTTMLDDKPPPGVTIINNVTPQQLARVEANWRDRQAEDELGIFGRGVVLHGFNPAYQVAVESVEFSKAPELFDYIKYTEMQANAWALILGIDANTIWRRTSGNLSSGNEGQLSHDKEGGRLKEVLRSMFERAFNTQIFPTYINMVFERRDPSESEARAKTALLWTQVAAAITAYTTPEEIRRLVAENVPEYFDIVADPKGDVIALTDRDVLSAQQTQGAALGTEAPTVTPAAPVTTGTSQTTTEKALQATRLDFEDALEDLVSAGRGNKVSKRIFIASLRAMIAKYGYLAMVDGLVSGGVDKPDEKDSATYAGLLVSQSKYIQSFADTLYSEGITDAQSQQKPLLWFNGSIAPFYQAGVESADSNGLYAFGGKSGIESCPTCVKLMGVRHRMRIWTKMKLRPRIDRENFECGGYQCEHLLIRTSPKKARFVTTGLEADVVRVGAG